MDNTAREVARLRATLIGLVLIVAVVVAAYLTFQQVQDTNTKNDK